MFLFPIYYFLILTTYVGGFVSLYGDADDIYLFNCQAELVLLSLLLQITHPTTRPPNHPPVRKSIKNKQTQLRKSIQITSWAELGQAQINFEIEGSDSVWTKKNNVNNSTGA